MVQERLKLLRAAMRRSGLDAYIITGFDPHVSECSPERWRSREWISGFTGSAGLLAITKNKAGLWTDFRYWIQASSQLAGSDIELFRVGKEGAPKIHDWILRELRDGGKVGINGRSVTLRMMNEWREAFENVDIVTGVDLLGEIWNERPPLPNSEVYELDLNVAGETRLSRLARLAAALDVAGADTWIGVALDSIAWLLNIRGDDIRYVPVVLGYLIFSEGKAVWYTNGERLSALLTASLAQDGVKTASYEDFFPALGKLRKGSRVLLDDRYITQAVLDWLAPDIIVKFGNDPVVLMKSRKNEIEVAQIRRAMVKDGIALIRFMIELENALYEGNKLTELVVREMLDAKRAELEGFRGNSFTPIVAYGANAALVHYGGDRGEDEQLKLDSRLLLVDSGAQWEEGTTDVTRTSVLGEPNLEQIRDYTLVLKGHIAISRARFPRGTRGYQLDTLGRAVLWAGNMDCGHALGHGVGYRLGVHEGPQRLSQEPVDVPLEPGMIVSNEPGVYREGLGGVRIENLLLCRDLSDGDFGVFLDFETLTLAPYELKLVDISMLDNDEIAWINEYHRRVSDCLSPFLLVEERGWLESKTTAI